MNASLPDTRAVGRRTRTAVDHPGLTERGHAPSNRVIVVEFGPLTADQKAFVDLHPLRAVGTEPPAPQEDNGVVIEFWVRDCETAEELYDDIRGWAIGNRLPVRGLVAV